MVGRNGAKSMSFPNRTLIYLSALMLIARLLANVMAPSEEYRVGLGSDSDGDAFILEDVVPSSFEGWNLDPSIRIIQPNEEGDLKSRVYDQTISRGYRDENGYLIMIVIAYGHNQSDTLQLHRPEVCYVANGFRIVSNEQQDVKLTSYFDVLLPSLRLVTVSSIRPEVVTYWTRVGDTLPTSNLSRQYEKLKFGLFGNIPDGVLVRVSSISEEPEAAYKMHDKFINDLIDIMDEKYFKFFLGPLVQDDKNSLKNTPVDKNI